MTAGAAGGATEGVAAGAAGGAPGASTGALAGVQTYLHRINPQIASHRLSLALFAPVATALGQTGADG